MTTCRTLDEVYAAATADSIGDPSLTQAQADLIAAILPPHLDVLVTAQSDRDASGRAVPTWANLT
jgi:hypothetical protein